MVSHITLTGTLVRILVITVVALLVAWLVNGLVGLLSGERPRDTNRLGMEVFLRLFAVLELGIIGRILNYIGLDGLPRKIVLLVGLLGVLLFLLRTFHHEHTDATHSGTYLVPSQSP